MTERFPRSTTTDARLRRSDTWCRIVGILLAIVLVATCGNGAQQDSGPTQKLAILPYPAEEEVNESFFSSEGFRVSPLEAEDINREFSNLDDLAWLQPLVKECRVVLLGETHYYQCIHHLRNRFVFALNTFDRYPFVILERQYSLTPFLNHYVDLSDKEAGEFERANKALFLNGFTVDFEFLQHVRRWNATHPQKQIQIGCYDIEHDACLTIERILRPYFTDARQTLEANGQTVDANVPAALSAVARIFAERCKCSADDLKDALGPIKAILGLARDANAVGRYPFLTTDFIERVIVNLESTHAAYSQDVHRYRQQAMIRNLTDPDYLGASFTSGKVLLHAGAIHTATGVPYSQEETAPGEGSYLAHAFEPTQGKTFSLFLSGFAFSSVLELKQIDLNTYGLLRDTAYGHMVAKVQQEAARGALAPDTAYAIVYEEELESMPPGCWAFWQRLIHIAHRHQNRPLVIHRVPWASLREQATQVSPEHAQTVSTLQEQWQMHDLSILVPISPPTVPR